MVHFLESISSIAGHVWRYLHKTGDFKHTLSQQVALAMQPGLVNPRSISWGFSTSVDSGCLNLLVALVSSSWAHGRYSYNLPSFRDRISSHALCFSSNVQLIPHVVKCYTCVFQCMQNYCLVRNYCWRHVFLPPNSFCMFVILHAFAGFETAKKPNETAKKPDETAKQIKSLKCGNWSGEKNWKRRTFRQPAIFIAVSDFER